MNGLRMRIMGARAGAGVVAFFLAFAICVDCAGPAGGSLSARPERIILNPTQNPSTGMAATWRTTQSIENPQAQIAEATAAPDFRDKAISAAAKTETVKIDGANPVYYHSVVFESLKPSTLYAYRVGSPAGWSEWNHFRTASATAKPFSFVYLGDPQNEIESMCSRVFRAAQMKAPDAAFWLFVGDIVNNGENDDEWREFYDAIGWIPRSIPMILLPGNHEYKKTLGVTEGLTYLWRPQFTFPENGPAGLEELKEASYYIEYQGALFVTLNGNERLEEQAKWLKKVLSDNPWKWTIVSIHQPFYSTAGNRDNPYHKMLFTDIFDKYGVDLVLQGHDHTYGRTHKVFKDKKRKDKGTVYVVTVTGPKQYKPSELYKDIMAKTGTQTQLFQVVSIDGDKLTYESFDVTGELFDSFELTKTN